MEEGGVEAHDRKLQKSLAICEKEGIHFVPLAWESTGGATETVHETVRKWTELEGARGGYPAHLIPATCMLISRAASRGIGAVIDRHELVCERAS